jgi:hypothetical protein
VNSSHCDEEPRRAALQSPGEQGSLLGLLAAEASPWRSAGSERRLRVRKKPPPRRAAQPAATVYYVAEKSGRMRPTGVMIERDGGVELIFLPAKAEFQPHRWLAIAPPPEFSRELQFTGIPERQIPL